jgi:uncharacterized membrane protein
MNWLQRFRIRHYIRNSIWILPLLGMIAALLAVRLLNFVETRMGWEMEISKETARAVMSTMSGSLFTLVVFVSSAILVAVQLTSAQLTPRIIAFIYRNMLRKVSLTFFVFTFTFSISVMIRIENSVPLLTTYMAAYGFMISIGLFLFMIDYVGKGLKPSVALRGVAVEGRDVVRSIYPRGFVEARGIPPDTFDSFDMQPTQIIVNRIDGVLLGFDMKGLVSLAEGADCLIELVPQVGDFVARENPLFRIYQGGAGLKEEAFLKAVAFGLERTMEQDPTFVFRIIVDVASKGLSPGINDPTTAVLAIDQLHHLLRDVGNRRMDEGVVRDAEGRLRLVYRTPNWEDFVQLAVTEIRHYGRESIQIARRLRAMLENLIQTLPEERAPLLQQELNLLRRSTERSFPEPEDKALAEVSDSQGVGGRYGKSLTAKSAEEVQNNSVDVSPLFTSTLLR